jgi:hypothetical protein
MDCHDLKDRFTLEGWPIHLLGPSVQGCKAPEAWELLLALSHSMPVADRSRFSLEEFPTPTALGEWSNEKIVAGVLAATSTEARIYLAKCVSLSWDWRTEDGNVVPAAI